LLELDGLDVELLLGLLEDDGADAGDEEATLPSLLADGTDAADALLASGAGVAAAAVLLSPALDGLAGV
jgi:hypothetical protein